MKNMLTTVIGFICLTLVGCTTTKKDWELATQLNTIVSYENFILSHPNAEEDEYR